MVFGFIDFSLSCRDAELRGSVLRLGGFQLLARGGLQIKESLRSVTNPQLQFSIQRIGIVLGYYETLDEILIRKPQRE